MTKKQKVTLLHLTWDHPDIEWSFTTSGGKGGQNVNKRATKARVVHKPSGASGVDASERTQHANRKNAWVKMASSDKFRAWARMEAARLSGRLDNIDEVVEDALKRVKVERKVDGKWQPWSMVDDGLEDASGHE